MSEVGCTPRYLFLKIDKTSIIHLIVQGLASANGETEELILTDLKRQTTYPVIWKAELEGIGLVKRDLYCQSHFGAAIDERDPISVQESISSRSIKEMEGVQTHNLMFITMSTSWNRMSGLVEALHENVA